jgi:serine/threonine-protein kinase
MKDELLAGRYQLEGELGRGGMATVFLARDLKLSRQVAVKVMHPGEDGRRTERFRREAELVASLKHPNVLEVHDFGEDAVRGPFLVCEWVQGENLRELARRLAPVPPEVAAVLGWELARALEAAHARGVVHRDVKPENVLVSRGGPLKLADFGIAALADQERLTTTGSITGSLAYMAPERIDTGAYSPASDVYAVGVILFELCTGTTPHAGQGSAHLAASVMTRDAPPLSEAAPGTPEPLSALVGRCLARDSRDRPADGAALAAQLEEVVGQLAGPPADASRGFFQDPEADAARWREARFERLLSEGRVLLSRGEGARAARRLNEALTLRPGSAEVLALLRAKPRVRRGRVMGAAALAGLVGALAAWGWHAWPEEAPTSVTEVHPVPPSQVAATPPEPATHTGTQLPGTDPALAVAPPTLTAAAPPPRTEPAQAIAQPTLATGAQPQGTEPAPATPRRAKQAAPASSAPPPRTEPALAASPGVKQAAFTEPAPAIATATAAPPPRTSTSKQAGPPRHTDAPAPAAAVPAPIEAPRPGLEEPATVTVVTRPWAEVFVDGQSRGYTPRVREVRLSPGTHRLRFVNPLCDVVEEELHVTAGQTLSREVKLQVRKAEVRITAPPGARVFLDGVELGVAPLEGPVNIEHGEHLVTARGPDGKVWRRELHLTAGTRIDVVLGSEP